MGNVHQKGQAKIACRIAGNFGGELSLADRLAKDPPPRHYFIARANGIMHRTRDANWWVWSLGSSAAVIAANVSACSNKEVARK